MAQVKTSDPFAVEPADKPADVPAVTLVSVPADAGPSGQADSSASEIADKPASGQAAKRTGGRADKRSSVPARKRPSAQAAKRPSTDRGPTLYVRLTAGEHDWLRDLAHVERVPVAAVVRALVDMAIADPGLAAQAVEAAAGADEAEKE